MTDPNVPHGDGYGSAVVDRAGVVVFNGVLGDRTEVSQTARLSKDGAWPLFLEAYSPTGSVSGRVNFQSAPQPAEFDGSLTWFKPASAAGSNDDYPAGFLIEHLPLIGSPYTPPAPGQRVLNFTTGKLETTDGNAGSSPVSRSATLNADNTVTMDDAEMTITLQDGLFTGSFTDQAGQARLFGGALLQSQNIGLGFFLGESGTGAVRFGSN